MKHLGLLLVLPFILSILVGCGKKPGGEPVLGETDGLVEADATAEAAEGDYGLYSDPGDLPECDVEWPVDDDTAYIAYADIDGDGQRECLGVGERNGDAEEPDPGYFGIARYGDDGWEIWDSSEPGWGEHRVDENSIAFAEDINEDGAVEVGVMFYDEFNETGVRSEPLYVWRVREHGIARAINEMRFGGSMHTLSFDVVDLLDILPEGPGREIVRFSPVLEKRWKPDQEHLYEVEMLFWGSLGEFWSLPQTPEYISKKKYADASAAHAAFVADRDAFRLKTAADEPEDDDEEAVEAVPEEEPVADTPGDRGKSSRLVDEGWEKLDDGDWEGAENSFARAVEADVTNPAAFLGHGVALRGLSQDPETGAVNDEVRMRDAIEVLSHAVDLDPRDYQAWYERGLAHSEYGRTYFMEDGDLGERGEKFLNNALTDFAAAAKRNPDHCEAYLGAAEVHSAMGQPRKAIAEYEKVLKRIPDNTTARQGIARCKREL